MKKILFIILILILKSVPSYSDTEFKGLLCKCIECNSDKLIRGYIISDIVSEFIFVISNDKFYTNQNDHHNFNTTVDNILWSDSHNIDIRYILNRKNLSLTIRHIKPKNKKEVRQCYRFDKEPFWKELSNIQKLYNKNLKNRLKDNKI